MNQQAPAPSARRTELLEAAYSHVLEHGLAEMSLRPLAHAIGSSPRVLLYLFGSKDGLIRALLARARADELTMLARLQQRGDGGSVGLAAAAEQVWSWLSSPEHGPLLTLWVEAYARSLTDPDGPWAGFAETTVQDWLALLSHTQPLQERDVPTGQAAQSAVLALLRGALLDLLATGDVERTTLAVRRGARLLANPPTLPATVEP